MSVTSYCYGKVKFLLFLLKSKKQEAQLQHHTVKPIQVHQFPCLFRKRSVLFFSEWKKIPPVKGRSNEKVVYCVAYYYRPHDYNSRGAVWVVINPKITRISHLNKHKRVCSYTDTYSPSTNLHICTETIKLTVWLNK